MNPKKSYLHELIDELPDNKAAVAEKFILFLIHEENFLFAEALDEDMLTLDTMKDIQEAEEEIKAGKTLSLNKLAE